MPVAVTVVVPLLKVVAAVPVWFNVVLPSAAVAAAAFKVSPVNALPALGLPVAPLTLGNTSLTASIGAAPTFTVAVAGLQFAGFNFSQIVIW